MVTYGNLRHIMVTYGDWCQFWTFNILYLRSAVLPAKKMKIFRFILLGSKSAGWVGSVVLFKVLKKDFYLTPSLRYSSCPVHPPVVPLSSSLVVLLSVCRCVSQSTSRDLHKKRLVLEGCVLFRIIDWACTGYTEALWQRTWMINLKEILFHSDIAIDAI